MAIFLALAACSAGGEPDIVVDSLWARATTTGQGTTAVYARIENRGTGADRLESVTIAAPAKASLHRTETTAGVARMRPIEGGLEIPAGEEVHLEPGGTHIMVTGLEKPLRAGERIPIVLRFDRSASRSEIVTIRDAALGNPAAHTH